MELTTIQKNTNWADAATAINKNYQTLIERIEQEKGGVTFNGAPSYPRINVVSGSATLSPNTFYVFGADVTTIDISFEAGGEAKTNEYFFQFVGGENTSLSIADSVVWAEELVIEDGKTYQVSILNGYATYAAFNTKQ
jgi:hypothetical protein